MVVLIFLLSHNEEEDSEVKTQSKYRKYKQASLETASQMVFEKLMNVLSSALFYSFRHKWGNYIMYIYQAHLLF